MRQLILPVKSDASLVKLVEKKGRNGVLGFMKSGFQALKKKASKLKEIPGKRLANTTKYIL